MAEASTPTQEAPRMPWRKPLFTDDTRYIPSFAGIIRFWIAMVVIFAIACLIEWLVFNWYAMTTAGIQSIEPIAFSGNLNDEGVPEVSDTDPVVFYFDDAEVRTIAVNPWGWIRDNYNLWVFATDEGTQDPYALGKIAMYDYGVYPVWTRGKATSLQLWLVPDTETFETVENIFDPPGTVAETMENATLNVEVTFNDPVPWDWNWGRIAAMVFVMAVVWVLRPTSGLYAVGFRSRGFLAFLLLLLTIAVFMIGLSDDRTPVYGASRQYEALTEALAEGEVALAWQPPPELEELDNVYDPTARREVEGWEWDVAYYNGRYYVYFGVLPVVLFMLPWYLISGTQLSIYVVATLCTLLALLAWVRFVWAVCDRWLPRCSLGMFLILCLTAILGSWLFIALRRPDIYVTPLTLAVACAVFGLAQWITATKEPETRLFEAGRSVVGSIFIALTLLSRPTLILMGVFAFPLVIPGLLTKDRERLSHNLQVTAFAVLPFAAVALVAGAYNNARFGSFTDFGAAYNLTNNDLIHRPVNLTAGIHGIYSYLFQTPNLVLSMPYLVPVSTGFGYLGSMPPEDMRGGLFFLTPLLLPALLAVVNRPMRPMQKTARVVAIVALACAVLLAGVVANLAGLIFRYMIDSATFLVVGAVIAIAMLWGNGLRDNGAQRLLAVGGERQGFTARGLCLMAALVLSLDSLLIWWVTAWWGVSM